MFRPTALSLLLVVSALAACQSGVPQAQETVQRADTAQPSLNAVAEGGCWATDVVPAQYQSVLEEVVLAPARTDQRGRVVIPAETETRERQVMVAPAEERLFAVPCPQQMDGEFVTTLQRALSARGLHAGPANGTMDAATRDAVRRFQQPQGLNSDILSLSAAQQLGLIVLPRHAF